MSGADARGALAYTTTGPLPAGPRRLVGPSLPIVVVLRVLLAVGLLTGLVTLASQPAEPTERTVGELLAQLDAGVVSELTIERWEPGVLGQGLLRVDWTEDGKAATTRYEYSTIDGSPVVDEGAAILRAARQADVPVTTVPEFRYADGWTMPAGPSGILATVGTLLLLAGGDQPRFATKWAWFWLGAVTPLWIVFLLLEPLPLWATRPQPAPARPLTGGWAFLLVVALAKPLIDTLGPDWAFLIGG